jgi:glucose-1-phosphatase
MQSVIVNSSVQNLVFDLGGVIINLSVRQTYQAFSQLSGLTSTHVEELTKAEAFFYEYETGTITSDDFRKSVRKILALNCSDSAIDEAWNAMLLDIPTHRINILLQLKNKYRLFLLSNTNEIHKLAFNKCLFECSGHNSFDSIFEKVYLSHEVGLRKPDSDIYSLVLQQNSLLASETLFFDDTELNLFGAHSVGIHTFHVKNADELFKELDKLK